MIIKDIAYKYGFNCDDFERWLVTYAGVRNIRNLRELDLDDARVDEIVQRYATFDYNRRRAFEDMQTPAVPIPVKDPNSGAHKGMSVTRLVLGIITMVIAVIVLILAIGNGVKETVLSDYYVNYGSVEMFVSFFFLLAEGIVMVACNKKGVLGGCIACLTINVIGIIITLASEAYVIGLFIIFVILGLVSLAGIIVKVSIKK